jgi:hypothetical protein
LIGVDRKRLSDMSSAAGIRLDLWFAIGAVYHNRQQHGHRDRSHVRGTVSKDAPLKTATRIEYDHQTKFLAVLPISHGPLMQS